MLKVFPFDWWFIDVMTNTRIKYIKLFLFHVIEFNVLFSVQTFFADNFFFLYRFRSAMCLVAFPFFFPPCQPVNGGWLLIRHIQTAFIFQCSCVGSFFSVAFFCCLFKETVTSFRLWFISFQFNSLLLLYCIVFRV